MLVMPVANGVMPFAEGGNIIGAFMPKQGGAAVIRAGVGKELLICPWIEKSEKIYPVGIVTVIRDIWFEKAMYENGESVPIILARLEGRGFARWHNLRAEKGNIFCDRVEPMKMFSERLKYPVLSGAGWVAEGGCTEFKGINDIPVTVYGYDTETGDEVEISANLGGVVSEEHAHTIEHGIIRALNVYGLCTPKTLIEAMAEETDELKQTMEIGMRFTLPEILGATSTGQCGNQMTNIAQFYLNKDFITNLEKGKDVVSAVEQARKSAMSHVVEDIGLTMQKGIRVLQGLKLGMSHDDTPISVETAKKVIARFPFDPWS
ncbi:MAG: hypothetical protein WCV63_00665 [Negativicutes bacterium]|jgi:hypothetical protein